MAPRQSRTVKARPRGWGQVMVSIIGRAARGQQGSRDRRNFRRALLASCVALSVAPAAAHAQQQLIANGGFESVSGTTPINWTLSMSNPAVFFVGAVSSNPNPIFSPNTGFTIPISGTRSLLFTQINPSSGYAYQQVTLPSFLSTARLSFSYVVNLQGSTSSDQARADIVAPANVSALRKTRSTSRPRSILSPMPAGRQRRDSRTCSI
jgi:hypothetical protein